MGEQGLARCVGAANQCESRDRSARQERRRRGGIDEAARPIANEGYDFFARRNERTRNPERLPKRADEHIGFDALSRCQAPAAWPEDTERVGLVD